METDMSCANSGKPPPNLKCPQCQYTSAVLLVVRRQGGRSLLGEMNADPYLPPKRLKLNPPTLPIRNNPHYSTTLGIWKASIHSQGVGKVEY